MLKLAIFDFDNTLLELGVDWLAVKRDVAALAASRGIAVDASQHLIPMGNLLSEKHGLKAGVDAIYLKHEMVCARNRTYTLFLGMMRLVKDLRAAGVKTAIASANHSESILAVLEQAGLAADFDLIVGRDNVKKNKPSPDQLRLILRKLRAKKADAVFLGDSPTDGQAAEAAGIKHFRVARDGSDSEMLRAALLPGE